MMQEDIMQLQATDYKEKAIKMSNTTKIVLLSF